MALCNFSKNETRNEKLKCTPLRHNLFFSYLAAKHFLYSLAPSSPMSATGIDDSSGNIGGLLLGHKYSSFNSRETMFCSASRNSYASLTESKTGVIISTWLSEKSALI